MTARTSHASACVCAFISVGLLFIASFKLSRFPNSDHIGPSLSLFETVFGDDLATIRPLLPRTPSHPPVRLQKPPHSHNQPFGFHLNIHNVTKRLPTLDSCYNGSASRFGRLQDFPTFSEWTGDVLLQTDNRVVNFSTVSAWNARGHNEEGFVYNALLSQKFHMLHLFVHGAEECVSPSGETLIGYWCKVPTLRVAMHAFPRARSIIYIDSDAYFHASASADAFFKVHQLDLGENSSIYVQHDNSFWNVLVEEAYTVRYALNSGVIVFSPQSLRAREAINLWWRVYTKPMFQSDLDAYKSQIHMSLFFGETCTFRNESAVISKREVFEEFRNAFETLVSQHTKHVPLEFFFAPAAVRLDRAPLRMEWKCLSSYKDRNKRFVLKARFGHFANATEIANVEKDLKQRPGKIQLALNKIIGCESTKMRYATDRSNDFKHSWPGDQDRLQHLRERFPHLVSVLPFLATLTKLPRGSLRINRLVWHPCLSIPLKAEAKEFVLNYLVNEKRISEAKLLETLRNIPALCINSTQNL